LQYLPSNAIYRNETQKRGAKSGQQSWQISRNLGQARRVWIKRSGGSRRVQQTAISGRGSRTTDTEEFGGSSHPGRRITRITGAAVASVASAMWPAWQVITLLGLLARALALHSTPDRAMAISSALLGQDFEDFQPYFEQKQEQVTNLSLPATDIFALSQKKYKFNIGIILPL